MIELMALTEQCAPSIPKDIMSAVVLTESQKNPFAIGVVNGYVKQPKTKAEAINTAYQLESQGKNFSMGIAQINKYNLKAYGVSFETIFDPCTNLRVGSLILLDCYKRASKGSSTINESWEKAFSCYYSGNFKTGFKQDFPNQPPYVTKIVNRLIAIQRNSLQNNVSNELNSIAVKNNNSFANKQNLLANSNATMQNETAINNVELLQNGNNSTLNTIGAIKLVNYQKGANNSNPSWDVFNSPKSNKIF